MLPAVAKVQCTNCGSSPLAIWLAAGALAVALGALCIAVREHRVFMRELNARANFAITLELLNFPDAVVRSTSSVVFLRLKIGIKNTGRKAARTTILNVVFPQFIHSIRWSGPQGEETDPPPPIHPTAETLPGPGDGIPARWIAREVPRIGLKPHYVTHVNFRVEIPTDEPLSVPLKVKAEADELPDAVDEVVATLPVRVEPRVTTG